MRARRWVVGVVLVLVMSPPLVRAEAEPEAGTETALEMQEPTVLAIVPRAVWDPSGVAKGERYPREPAKTYTRIVVHHSDFLEPPGPAGIKAYHLEVSGFSDIGYHFVISPDGTVFEGRPLARMGAHAGATREAARGDRRADPDWGAVGIVLDGYFGDALPPAAQRDALLLLIEHLQSTLPRVRDVIGHREVRAGVLAAKYHPIGDLTVCPGDALFTWLEAERALGAFDTVEKKRAAAPSEALR